jgi:hypothetical protein
MHQCTGASAVAMKIKLDELKNMAKFKGTLQQQIPPAISSNLAFKHVSVQAEAKKAALFVALSGLTDGTCQAEANLTYLLHPQVVLANCGFKKGELKLIPMTDTLSKLTISDSTKVVEPFVQVEGCKVCISPPSLVKSHDPKMWGDKQVMVAYWCVGSAENEEAANMMHSTVKYNDINIPVLVNKVPIKKGDKLLKYQAKKLLKPLLGIAAASSNKRKSGK